MRWNIGGICLWSPVERKRPKTSHRIKFKVVRVLHIRVELPGLFTVAFYLDGSREPPTLTNKNKCLLTIFDVKGSELKMSAKEADVQSAGWNEKVGAVSSDLSLTSSSIKVAAAQAATTVAEITREVMKETGFFVQKTGAIVPTSLQMEEIFESFYEEACALLKGQQLDMKDCVKETCLKLERFKMNGISGGWPP